MEQEKKIDSRKILESINLPFSLSRVAPSGVGTGSCLTLKQLSLTLPHYTLLELQYCLIESRSRSVKLMLVFLVLSYQRPSLLQPVLMSLDLHSSGGAKQDPSPPANLLG